MSSVWRLPPLRSFLSARSKAATVSENSFGTAGQTYSVSDQSALDSRIFYENEGFERRASDFAVPAFEFGEFRVSFVISRNQRQPDFVGGSGFDERGVDLRTPDDEDFRLPFRSHHPYGIGGGSRGNESRPTVSRRGNYDVLAVRQRTELLRKRLVRFPAHHHRLARSEPFEVRQIFRKVPREGSRFPDDPIFFSHRGDQHGLHQCSGLFPPILVRKAIWANVFRPGSFSENE